MTSRAPSIETAVDNGLIARVDIFHSMAEAEAIWHRMETPDHFLTPFQRFEFLSAWQADVGHREGIHPFVLVAYDRQSNPLALIPLGIRSENGAHIARFLGGKHATFNMPLYATNFADSATKADFETLFELTGTQEKNVDLLAFERQPLQWRTIKNPLSLLPKQASINACPLLDLVPHTPPEKRISNSFRRRLRGKERKLQPLPGYGYRIAQTDDDIRRTLRAFFIMKRQRMAAQKLPDVFSEPGIEDFIVAACLTKRPDGRRGIEIHILDCDDELIAIFAGVADGHRFSMMFNTYTISDNAKYSPGLILLRDIIDHYAKENYTSLDLGIGADEYKRLFCKDDETLFDSFIPLSTRGSLTALGLSSVTHAKRLVKQTPALAQMAQLVRGALRR